MRTLHLILIFICFMASSVEVFADFASQCETGRVSPSLTEFATKVEIACVKYAELCHEMPAHYNCVAATGVSQENEQVGAKALRLNLEFGNALSDVVSDLFSDPNTYEQKGAFLDAQSRRANDFNTAFISHIVLSGTMEWVELFGDPYRDENLYGEIEPTSHRARLQEIETAQRAGATIGYLSAVGAMFVMRSPRISPFVLIKKIPFLAARFRMSVPLSLAWIEAIGATNVTVTPSIWAARFGSGALKAEHELPPSPAHMVRFNYLEDMSVVTADMEAAWAHKDFETFQEIFKGTGALGIQLAVGDLGITYGSRATNHTLRWLLTSSPHSEKALINGTKTLSVGTKAVRFLRLTPASLVAGAVAGEVIEESVKSYRLHKLEKRLDEATPATINQVLNELFHVFVGKSHFTKTLINFYRALEQFGKIETQAYSSPNFVLARGNFLAFFDDANHPELTGARMIQKAICKTMDLLPPIAKAKDLTEKQRKEINTREAMIIGGLSWQFFEKLRKEIKKYKSSLNEYANYLHSMKRNHSSASTALNQRIDAIARWVKEADAIVRELQIPSWTEELTQVHATKYAHDKIQSAVRQIIMLEWRRNDPSFNTLYRCQ